MLLGNAAVATVTISSAVNLLIVGVLWSSLSSSRRRASSAWFQQREERRRRAQPATVQRRLGKRFGGFVALDGINLEVRRASGSA